MGSLRTWIIVPRMDDSRSTDRWHCKSSPAFRSAAALRIADCADATGCLSLPLSPIADLAACAVVLYKKYMNRGKAFEDIADDINII